MGAGDQHELATRFDEPLRAGGKRWFVVIVGLREPPRLHAVRRQYRRLRQKQLPQRVKHFVARKLVATAGRQHRVEHQRYVGIVGQDLRDRGYVLDAAQCAYFERIDRHVLEQAARLVGDPVGIDRLQRFDSHGVLHGDRGDHRQRVATHAGERQDVGLNARAAGRIGRGEGEHQRREVGVLICRIGHRGFASSTPCFNARTASAATRSGRRTW